MRFLVDESVSPTISQVLIASGHDSVNVRDVLGTGADDLIVLRAAVENDRVIITQDRDFGTLLHAPGTLRASVVLLRLHDGRPSTHAAAVLRVAGLVADELAAGAIVVVDDASVRVRRLPHAGT